MKTSDRGITLIKEFEGFKSSAYLDPVGIWTIGYGFIDGVKPGDKMTRAEADSRLREELGGYEASVLLATGGNVSQQEFDALVCFAWNVGSVGMMNSSVIKFHNQGDKTTAASAFKLWNKAGGKVLNGLVRRRKAESEYYLTGTTTEVKSWDSKHSLERPLPQSSPSLAPGSPESELEKQTAQQKPQNAMLSGLLSQIAKWLTRK